MKFLLILFLSLSSPTIFAKRTFALIIRADGADVLGTEKAYSALINMGVRSSDIELLDNLDRYPVTFKTEEGNVRSARSSKNEQYNLQAQPFETLGDIEKSFSRISSKILPNDQFIFITQSHGAREMSEFTDTDGKPGLRESSALSMEVVDGNNNVNELSFSPFQLKKMLDAHIPKSVSAFIMVSACYSGYFTDILDPDREMTIVTTAGNDNYSWGSRVLVNYFKSFSTLTAGNKLKNDFDNDGLVDFGEAFQAARRIEDRNELMTGVIFDIKTIYFRQEEKSSFADSKFISNTGGKDSIGKFNESKFELILGDLDGNGVVDYRDKEISLAFHQEAKKMSPYQELAADINQDQILDRNDLLQFSRIITPKKVKTGKLKLINPLWLEKYGDIHNFAENLIYRADKNPSVIPKVNQILNNAIAYYDLNLRTDPSLSAKWMKIKRRFRKR